MASSRSGSGDFVDNIELLNNQISDLMRDKNEIEDEKKSLMDRVESLEKERAQLYEDLSEVKKDIEIVYQDEDERRQQIEELCRQVQGSISSEKYQALLKERDTLAGEIASFRGGQSLELGEREALESRIKELEFDRNQLRDTCDKVNEDLKTIVNDIDSFEQREKNYVIQIEDLNRQLGSLPLLRKEINNLKEENEMLSSRVQQLEQVGSESNQERLKSQSLMDEISDFEDSLKRLQQREGEYNKQIGALTQDLGRYTIDTEKLRLDNSILQDQVASLNEELSQNRENLSQIHAINKRLTGEYSALNHELSRLREDKNRTALELDAFINTEHRLKEDLEKIKLEYQSLKIRNLVLEDKVEILERERARLNELNRRLGQRHAEYPINEAENFKRQIRELKTENIHLREQIDEMRTKERQNNEKQQRTPLKSSRVLKEQDKENMTPNRGTYQDKGYMDAIERLKDELKHVRESREAILSSLEKERVSIRDAIEDSSRVRLSFSGRKTPLKEQEKDLNQHATMTEHPHEPTARKSGFIHLTTHSAPETIKKSGGGTRLRFGDLLSGTHGQEEFNSRKSSESDKEKGNVRSISSHLHDERVRDISKFAFQILYWLTDNALMTKELTSVCALANDDKVGMEIKKIMKEVHEFAERAKSYYNHYITSKTDDEIRAVYEFILPLFNKCYKSHCELKEIQNRAINDLKHLSTQRAHELV